MAVVDHVDGRPKQRKQAPDGVAVTKKYTLKQRMVRDQAGTWQTKSWQESAATRSGR